ncbi:restriction endonuclease [Bradyrhizobium sp. GCM10023182]|uniref:Restriction endonuclease n=1 Tax=Bradyrhizobium zhengyangense TaxID=2911009 RepID=A0ABS9LS99_9BRAD|nr:restriction endonuclease [Bradyrhizobium zhengyangense]MCG2642698.1 restriction endonuclease [Bradyrhizobium zhengyangense]MCG2669694.1 restriction endonuclease [Bradyrhizobium zhengyangense]
MAQRSKYDELHDRYHAILSTKAGTRYEMLAAMVFKSLEDKNTVIHHLQLTGDSDVPHQIDVSIEKNGKAWRVIIECKDFDISGDKVGLDIVRNFRSVVEDTNADEAIIVTCTGYTRDAQKYAKAKNIKLAVLRGAEERDMEGRIKTVVVNLHIQSAKNHSMTMNMSEANRDLFAAECLRVGITGGIHIMHPVFLVRGAERHQFTSFMSDKVNSSPAQKLPSGLYEVRTLPDGWSLQVESGPLIQFDLISTTYEMGVQTIELNITSDRIAEMILAGVGDHDILIFDDQLQQRKIDAETGEIL